jgi:hypothetical protein
MRLLYGVIIGSLLLGGTVMGEAQRGTRGGGAREAAPPAEGSRVHADVRIVFSSAETQIIREHYQRQYRNLPPGLQKKLARTGTLPPGWQKKMEPFPAELERRLSPLPAGHRRGVLDGHAVIYLPGGVIVDTAVLF